MRSSRPLVAVALAFASGIWIAAQSSLFVFVIVGCVFLLSACFGITRRSFWLSLLLVSLFALFGAACYLLSTQVFASDVSRRAPAYVTVVGTVGSDTRVTPGQRPDDPASGRFTLNTRGIVIQDDVHEDTGRGVATSGEGVSPQTGARVVAVSGQVEARVPLAAVSLVRRTPTRGGRHNANQPSSASLQSGENTAETSAETSRIPNRMCRITAIRFCCAGDWNSRFPPAIRGISITPRT